jgi:hypothetical protein
LAKGLSKACEDGLKGNVLGRHWHGWRVLEISRNLATTMTHDSVEEHLAELADLVAQAETMGIDLWPETKPNRPWAKYALASFMIIMMLSWVSKVLFRFASV